jgi:hypothetical protein
LCSHLQIQRLFFVELYNVVTLLESKEISAFIHAFSSRIFFTFLQDLYLSGIGFLPKAIGCWMGSRLSQYFVDLEMAIPYHPIFSMV